MSIAEDVGALKDGIEPPSSSDCKMCWHLPRLTEADRAAIEWGLNGGLSAGKIAVIMTRNGRPTSKSAVQRHLSHRQEPTTA